jgi:pyruvate dehydrogenase E2 component (dihydrolipoamide acetyltransferase)
MTDIAMPRLSDSMEEGIVLRWLKDIGEPVSVGDELVEIETDKANMVFEAPAAGTLVEIIVAEGESVPVGELIARLGESSQAAASDGAPPGASSTGADGASAARQSTDAQSASSSAARALEVERSPRSNDVASPQTAIHTSTGGVKASPLARRIAAASGLDLCELVGSGPSGRITKSDVQRALGQEPADYAAPAPEASLPPTRPLPHPGASPSSSSHAPAGPAPGPPGKAQTPKGRVEVVELTRLQQTVARRMAESKATAPHFYLQLDVDMTKCVLARLALKGAAREGGLIPSFNDMVVKACALALRDYPRLNGTYRDGRIELHSRINVGMAVAARDALVVPNVFDADQKGLRQIAEETRALAERVRDGSVTPPELAGGTFTVSNLGMYGMGSIGPVINPPQAATLGAGEISERSVVRGGEIVIGHVMTLTLSCDHRVVYGATGAKFLNRVSELLAEPLCLAL